MAHGGAQRWLHNGRAMTAQHRHLLPRLPRLRAQRVPGGARRLGPAAALGARRQNRAAVPRGRVEALDLEAGHATAA